MRLLFVCTGNVCRSAAAHQLSQSWAAAVSGSQVEVRSGGTWARRGRPLHPFTAVALERRGLTLAPFGSSPLERADVDSADVVLTMTAQHREEVVATRACLPKIGGLVGDAGRMLRTDEIPDELWELIQPVLPAGGHQG
ncbi:Low molecular weight phosphotyrosine protein phosphatase, partial [Modestobacter sp. DSM 44400]|uniref:arsenate-mycothiol transferase ArsC n=1 Tax=Modestobacter sp. DSM 44400 TaxID=1550230 RepID=UPI00089C1364